MDLADVVKQRDALDLMLHRLVSAIRVGEDECIPGNPAHMGTRLLISRVDRVQPRLGRRRRESFGASTPAPLARQRRRAKGGPGRSERRQRPIGRFAMESGLGMQED